MNSDLSVAIAGGSLGGLTAGCLLRDLGYDVTIYERSRHSLEQRGAGIGFLYDAQRYLTERAGVSLDDISTRIDFIRYLHRDGSVAHERMHTYHFSSWFTVYHHMLESFGHERYLIGHEAVGCEQPDADHITVNFADGESVTADLLVCADGVGSVFREQFMPGLEREYSGYVAWRGMVPESELPAEVGQALNDAITYYFYANSQILVYPIPGADGSIEPGHRLINYVWYRNYSQGDDFNDLMTDASGVLQETTLPPGHVRDVHVAEMKAHAHARLPRVLAQVVEATSEPFVQVVFDLEVDQMVFGRAALVGDAGFLMRPHAAAGTAKAAANAWALADALEATNSVPEALAAWEPGQMAIGRDLVERTRRLGYASQTASNWTEPTDDTLFRLRDEGP